MLPAAFALLLHAAPAYAIILALTFLLCVFAVCQFLPAGLESGE